MTNQTETEIAKENTKWLKLGDVVGRPNTINVRIAQEHKSSCQRFLEFLEEHRIEIGLLEQDMNITSRDPKWLADKITDLKSAIKLYEENGI